MTRERCFIQALFIMLAICAVCSKAPERLGIKPSWKLCSIKLFEARKEYIKLRRRNVSTFKGTVSSVISLKLEGLFASSFLWMRIVQAFFHSAGTDPDRQTVCKISVRWVLGKGQHLKHISESWSKERGGGGRCFDFAYYRVLHRWLNQRKKRNADW